MDRPKCLICVHQYSRNTDKVWIGDGALRMFKYLAVNRFVAEQVCDIDNNLCDDKQWRCDEFIEQRSHA